MAQGGYRETTEMVPLMSMQFITVDGIYGK